MNSIAILAAAEKARIPITDALPHLAGMLMVMLTLTLLWGVCVITARLVKAFLPDNKPAAPVPEVTAPVVASGPQTDDVPPQILAVIVAAVAATVGKSQRIVSIKPISSSWERAGRQSVLTSHRIR